MQIQCTYHQSRQHSPRPDGQPRHVAVQCHWVPSCPTLLWYDPINSIHSDSKGITLKLVSMQQAIVYSIITSKQIKQHYMVNAYVWAHHVLS